MLVARLVGLAAFAVIGVAMLRRAHHAINKPQDVHEREIVLACGTALAAFAVLSPVFYPWYALLPLAVLSIAVTDPRTRTALAATAVVLAFLVLPNGLGLAVLTKLPGALLDVALVVAAAVLIRRRRAASAARPGGPATPTTTA